MEVTLQLDDQVAQAVQQRAADLGVTVAAQLEQTVREVYLPTERRERKRITKLHTTGQGGLKPGIDLNNMAATLDILDEYDAPH